jgi:hypothetical protein
MPQQPFNQPADQHAQSHSRNEADQGEQAEEPQRE